MPLRVRPTPVLLIPALALACNPWPRFTADPEPVGLFDEIFHPYEVVEDGDWPDDPRDLQNVELTEIVAPMQSVRFVGTLEEFGLYEFEVEGEPFENCDVAFGVEGHYTGDIDFVRISQPGGALCLILDAEADPAEPLWDVIAYPLDDSGCVTGRFLTLGTVNYADLPASTPPGGINIVEAESGEIGLYLTGAYGAYPPRPVPYTLNVVSTWDRGTCSELTLESFGDSKQ